MGGGGVPVSPAATTAQPLAEAEEQRPHLELRDVSKRYGDGPAAVERLNLSVEQGEFFGLLGPSGCGKSTTLNMVAGFVEPTSGSVLLSGEPIDERPSHRRGTAMVFQDYGLFPHLTVDSNVEFGMRLRKRRGKDLADRRDELLELVGLRGLGHRHPGELSGGQQQRVALARALAVDPPIVLLDEPLSNLDERLRGRVRDELTRILRDAGVTVLLVTHDQSEAFGMCDRVAVMLNGHVRQVGTPAELYNSPADIDVARFVGESTFLPAVVQGPPPADGLVDLSVRVGNTVVTSTARHVSGSGPEGLLQLRPEWVQMTPAASPTAPGGTASLQGRVRSRAFLGSVMEYVVEIAGRLITSRALSSGPLVDEGADVAVQWAGAAVAFHAGVTEEPAS